MKTAKNEDDQSDVTGSAQKKLKQARLPFQILSPKSTAAKQKPNEEENSAVKKRKLSDSSCGDEEKPATKLACTDAVKKSNTKLSSVKVQEIIVLEDSLDSQDALTEDKTTKNDAAKTNENVKDEEKRGIPERKATKRSLDTKSEEKTTVNNEPAKSKRRRRSEVLSPGQVNDENKKVNPVENKEKPVNKREKPTSKKQIEQTAKKTNKKAATETSKTDSEIVSDGNVKTDEEESGDDAKKTDRKAPETTNTQKKTESDIGSSSNVKTTDHESKDARETDSKTKSAVKTVNACDTDEEEKVVNRKIIPSCRTGNKGDIKRSADKIEKKIEIEKVDDSIAEGSVGDCKTSSVVTISDEDVVEDNCKEKKKDDGGEDEAGEEILGSPLSDKSNGGSFVTPRRGRLRSVSGEKKADSSATSTTPRSTEVTPTSDKKKGLTTPKARKLTPKQIEKQKESAKKREEQERRKQEKEQERKEKEEMINKMREERKRLKLEKEDQKRREREEKEKKRQADVELKNEEKRVKEEEKKMKEEEKKKLNEVKEEERRKRDEAKEEEKRKKEAEKLKEEKAASAFVSFFMPKQNKNNTSATPMDVDDEVEMVCVQEKFMPFEVKADMRLSTIARRTMELDEKVSLDAKLIDQNCKIDDLYVSLLRTKQHTPLTGEKTWPIIDDTDNDVIIIESEAWEGNCEEEVKVNASKKTARPRAKLLQFEDNRRPPYWGTWRKKSSVIGPRRPFKQDNTMFEYDLDSDDEWEEDEPGESLNGSDDEKEKESEDEYEVDNQVFVPHGYLSDEEAQDELMDYSREAQKAKLHFLELEFEAEMKKKTEKLKPRLIGCVWFPNSVVDPSSVRSHIAEVLLSRRAVVWDQDQDLPIEVNSLSSISSSPVPSPLFVEQHGKSKKTVFPESAVPMLIRLVHGNRYKHKFLVREFHNYMSQNSHSVADIPTLRAIEEKKREISEWMIYPQDENGNHVMAGKRCWYVSKEIREKYGVLVGQGDGDDPWVYTLEVPRSSGVALNSSVNASPNMEQQSPKTITPITKFTKKMSQEERQKQLLQSATPTTSSVNSPTRSKIPVLSKTPVAKKNALASFIKIKSKSPADDDVIVISPVKADEVGNDRSEKLTSSGNREGEKSPSVTAANDSKTGSEISTPKQISKPTVKKRAELTTISVTKKNPPQSVSNESKSSQMALSSSTESKSSPVESDSEKPVVKKRVQLKTLSSASWKVKLAPKQSAEIDDTDCPIVLSD